MSRPKCYLLDADVIIAAHEVGAWDVLTSACEVHVSSIVIAESKYYNDSAGRHPIDLASQADAGQIQRVESTPTEMDAFVNQFDPMLKDMLHQGEIEGLTALHLDRLSDDCLYCSGDGTALRTLGFIGEGERAISLQDALSSVGITKTLQHNFCSEYLKKKVGLGQRERLQGLGWDKS